MFNSDKFSEIEQVKNYCRPGILIMGIFSHEKWSKLRQNFGRFSVKIGKIWLSKTGNQIENHAENEHVQNKKVKQE